MGYVKEKLKALTVERLAKVPGMHGDGGGLYLRVKSASSRSWVFRYMVDRKAREMGLGRYPDISLAEARRLASEARTAMARRIDPIAQRTQERAEAQASAANAITFANAAEQLVASKRAGWRNDKHAAQWSSTLKTYAEPVFGQKPVGDIDTAMVLRVLEPIWVSKPETASRLRGRIEAVLDWAAVKGFRSDANPARWRGHLDKLLPQPGKVKKVVHHASLSIDELPEFMLALKSQPGVAARALEFAILTAARTGEVLGVKWSEFDLERGSWTVPATRMKAGREHRVPLSVEAAAIIKAQAARRIDGQDYVFPGAREGRPLSNMAMLKLLERMKRDDITTHGFRSTFRDWCAERTDYAGELAEMALAHVIRNQAEAAYRRGDLFDKRRQMMEDWAAACTPASDTTSPAIAA